MNIYNTIFEICGISCLCLTFTRFEPIQNQLKRILQLPGKIYLLIYKVLSCPTCLGLWVGLIITQNLYEASIISVFSSYLSYITNKI
jgi:hypothetical protein